MNSTRNGRIALAVLGGIILLAVLFTNYVSKWSSEAREARLFLSGMPVDAIREIRIEPYSTDRKFAANLTTQAVIVRDRKSISQTAEAFRQARVIEVNHPETKWAATVVFQLVDREYTGEARSTSNYGVLFHFPGRSWGNYGTYSVDALGPVFERIVNEKGTP